MMRLNYSVEQLPVSALILVIILFLVAGCQPFEPVQLVIVETGDVTDIEVTSCTFHGEILDTGPDGIKNYGFAWSDSTNPTIENATFILLGTGQGVRSFEYLLTGLAPSTAYHVRSYATGGDEIVFGDQKSFETLAGGVPSVSTLTPSEITFNSAICGGIIDDDGGVPVTARGVCWSRNPGPTLEDDHTDDGEGTGRFQSTMTSLEPGNIYYVRAYATNMIGTGYGGDLLFEIPWDGSLVTDFEGNEYSTVQIGWMVWTAMNIRSTRYSDGTSIPMVEGESEWTGLADTDRAFSYYNNDPANAEDDGALYTWAAATNGHPGSNEVPSGVQGVCPAGWHLPSDEEWKEFELILGMNEGEINSFEMRGTDQGGKLKETINWAEPNVGATNEVGFNARPSGYRESIGRFGNYGNATEYWTSTSSGESGAVFRRLNAGSGGIYRSGIPVKLGFSVRCVKDY